MGREKTVKQAQRKIQAEGRNRQRPAHTQEERGRAGNEVRQRQAKKEKQREG